jgi:hypothetical protein
MDLPAGDRARLEGLFRFLDETAPRCLGYPGNGRFDYTTPS